jgi:alanyl-tRNA synthetase
VRRTGDIGLFIVVGEGAVAAGVRRLDALTGKAAVDHVAARERLLGETAEALKVQPAELPARIAALLEERKKLERELSEARRALALGGGAAAGGAAANGSGAKEVNGIKLATRLLEGVPARELKGLADDLKKQIGSGVIVIVATHEGKAANLVAVTDDLSKRFDARELLKAGVAALGGQGGGGRADMAQGGGPAVDRGPAALAAIEEALRSRAAG